MPMPYFGHWSWCCVVTASTGVPCLFTGACAVQVTADARAVSALDNWCANALHAVTHDDGAIDAKNNDTHVVSDKVERHAFQRAGEFHQLASLHTLSPQVRAESVHVRNGSGALTLSTPKMARTSPKTTTHMLSVTRLSAMPLRPLEKIHRLACLQTLQPVRSAKCSRCEIEARAEPP